MTVEKINDLLLHHEPIRTELIAAASRVIDSGWYALGSEVCSFEDEFAQFCDVPHCVSVACGTDALQLAARSVGVSAGDEVIIAANAGMYSATALMLIGAKPVYADVEEDSMCLSVHDVVSKITERTKAIIVTHLFGQLADMGGFRKVANEYSVALIEDCAQSHAAELNGKRAGSWGDASAFSFYPTKNLGALGDGGAVITSREDVREKLILLRQYGWESKYRVIARGGSSSRLDEIQAAFLRVKLPFLLEWTERRRDVASLYNEKITSDRIVKPVSTGADYAGHLYVIRTTERDSLQTYLAERGIVSDVHYPLLDYQQPVMSDAYVDTILPVSEKVVSEILTLPCYPEMSEEDIECVSNAINRWAEKEFS